MAFTVTKKIRIFVAFVDTVLYIEYTNLTLYTIL